MIDLHTHTNASDGTLSPQELVRRACELNISAVAITDHDGIGGVKEALAEAEALAAEGKKIEVIPGVEISAAYKESDIHIVGLFINPNDDRLSNELAGAIDARLHRNEIMCEKLRETGFEITIDDLRRENPDTVITRAHFARYLVKMGYVKDIATVFDKYLGNNCPCFVPRTYMTPERAISIIAENGGIPILAHPLIYKLPESELEALVERLANAGLKGIEVYYSSNVNNDEDYARSLAGRFGLIPSGGTDFHGSNKPELTLGIGRGNMNIPETVLDRLKEAVQKDNRI